MQVTDLLGINARSAFYLRLNPKRKRKLADDKVSTKRLLKKHKIAHPKLIAVLHSDAEFADVPWFELEKGFVIKPAHGLGGEGILIVKRKSKQGDYWFSADGQKLYLPDIEAHVRDIIEGRYSRNNEPDMALVEERVRIHPKFRKLAYGGAPDVRVIVFNNVPVMGMLRVPTEESGGRANLHQGAIGLGIDIATGITTHAVYHGNSIKYFPDTNKKVNGITIPDWDKILSEAVKVQRVSGLGYLAVDFLIDQERGPLVLELNDQPGLAIQVANRAGLRKRLERVEGLTVPTVEDGIRIAKALFASPFVKRIEGLSGERQVVGLYEDVKVKVGKKDRVTVKAKIDTGATSSSIDEGLARELGLLTEKNILTTKEYRSALGKQVRKVIGITFFLKGKKISTQVGVTKRENLGAKLLIGRNDLYHFLVDPMLNLPKAH